MTKGWRIGHQIGSLVKLAGKDPERRYFLLDEVASGPLLESGIDTSAWSLSSFRSPDPSFMAQTLLRQVDLNRGRMTEETSLVVHENAPDLLILYILAGFVPPPGFHDRVWARLWIPKDQIDPVLAQAETAHGRLEIIRRHGSVEAHLRRMQVADVT